MSHDQKSPIFFRRNSCDQNFHDAWFQRSSKDVVTCLFCFEMSHAESLIALVSKPFIHRRPCRKLCVLSAAPALPPMHRNSSSCRARACVPFQTLQLGNCLTTQSHRSWACHSTSFPFPAVVQKKSVSFPASCCLFSFGSYSHVIGFHRFLRIVRWNVVCAVRSLHCFCVTVRHQQQPYLARFFFDTLSGGAFAAHFLNTSVSCSKSRECLS